MYIHESAGIHSLLVKGGLNTKTLANAITTTPAENEVGNTAAQSDQCCLPRRHKSPLFFHIFQAWVHFYPTVDQQKSCDSCDDKGMNGDLVVVYDVNRDTSLGDIKVHQDFLSSSHSKTFHTFFHLLIKLFFWAPPSQRSLRYFVHHFAPTNLPRIPKNVVFIIDQSGSMHGRKIEQVGRSTAAEAFCCSHQDKACFLNKISSASSFRLDPHRINPHPERPSRRRLLWAHHFR